MSNLPEELLINIDDDLILSRDPQDLIKAFSDLSKIIKRMYRDVYEAINYEPEYHQGAAPNPAEGQFQIWKDGGGALWLTYNDAGTLYKVQFTAI